METTAIPVTIEPNAAARVAELGCEREFENMLEYTRHSIPGLRSITVALAPPYDTGDEPCVRFEVIMDDPHLEYDPTERQWSVWITQTFPPDVFQHFVLLATYGTST